MCSFSRHLGFDQGLITKHHNPKVGHVMLRYMPTAERSAPEEKECNFTQFITKFANCTLLPLQSPGIK